MFVLRAYRSRQQKTVASDEGGDSSTTNNVKEKPRVQSTLPPPLVEKPRARSVTPLPRTAKPRVPSVTFLPVSEKSRRGNPPLPLKVSPFGNSLPKDPSLKALVASEEDEPSRTAFKLDRAVEKEAFLDEFSSVYGYDDRIDKIREREYPHMKGHVYLDHSSSTMYAKSAIDAFARDLSTHCYGNPHSQSPSSLLATERIDAVRLRVLNHFRADPDEFSVIFTANCTAALKLVGEMFPWKHGRSQFLYLSEAHMSLVGMRRFAEAAGARSIHAVCEEEIEAWIEEGVTDKKPRTHRKYGTNDTYDLFAYPAQCNLSGLRLPLSWPARLKASHDSKKSRLLVLLDAAAYVMTSPLSLADKDAAPDFTVISFYKMFGFPTGLGALIVKNELAPLLRKQYFGCGTILQVQPHEPWQRYRPDLPHRYEDGTINFLNIIALEHAFNTTERLYGNYNRIRAHVTSLYQFLYKYMTSLRHSNGQPVCVVYGESGVLDFRRQGAVFAFNFLKPNGNPVRHVKVERLAGKRNIHVRVGGHCNPGAVARWLSMSRQDFAVRYWGMTEPLGKGKPTGMVRLSLGAMSTIDDILAWLEFVQSTFVQ